MDTTSETHHYTNYNEATGYTSMSIGQLPNAENTSNELLISPAEVSENEKNVPEEAKSRTRKEVTITRVSIGVQTVDCIGAPATAAMNSHRRLKLKESTALTTRKPIDIQKPLPMSPRESSSVSRQIKLTSRHLAMLEDRMIYDEDLVDFCFRRILMKYEPRRIFTYFPARQFTNLYTGSNIEDFDCFVEVTKDLFSYKDLYFAAFIGVHSHTGVIRDVSRSIERTRSGLVNGKRSCTRSPQHDLMGVDLVDALDNTCTCILFDSDMKDAEVNASREHIKIANTMRRYILEVAQSVWGKAHFKGINNIDMVLHSAAIPPQKGKNDCAPTTLKCIELYAGNPEFCCESVLPGGNINHSFWMGSRRARVEMKRFVEDCIEIEAIDDVRNLNKIRRASTLDQQPSRKIMRLT